MSTLIDVERNGDRVNVMEIESAATASSATPSESQKIESAASASSATPSESQKVVAYKADLPVLKIGHAGEAVRFLQQRLIAVGYALEFNGQFGFQTDAAVKHFQFYYGGLLVDGVVGSKTWRALCENSYPYGYSFYSQAIPAFYAYETHLPNLGLGVQGNAVECLQLRLQSSGYRVLVDGIFGNNTRTAVELYQKRVGLKVDGLVGRLTWRAIGK